MPGITIMKALLLANGLGGNCRPSGAKKEYIISCLIIRSCIGTGVGRGDQEKEVSMLLKLDSQTTAGR